MKWSAKSQNTSAQQRHAVARSFRAWSSILESVLTDHRYAFAAQMSVGVA